MGIGSWDHILGKEGPFNKQSVVGQRAEVEDSVIRPLKTSAAEFLCVTQVLLGFGF